MLRKLAIVLCLFLYQAHAQKKPIQIIEKEIPNRLALYALNETDKDYDVMITIKGTNFRQSTAKPRLIRVPATSKVHLKTLILIRDKLPSYTYDLIVNDSLSNRAVRKQFELVKVAQKKIMPKKQIIIYVTNNCRTCDSLIDPLTRDNYSFMVQKLSEKPKLKVQLGKYLASSEVPIDSMTTPIVSLGGRLYTWINNYEQLLEELNKE